MKNYDSVFLWHIWDAASRIEEYLENYEEQDFLDSYLLQDAVIRQLEIIGEAVKHLSVKLRNSHPQIPWQDIAGMRDKLIHDYFGVDIKTVWLTAVEDIPFLKSEIKKILDAL